MKIDLAFELVAIDGSVLTETKIPKPGEKIIEKPLTAKSACASAVVSQKAQSPIEAVELSSLAIRLYETVEPIELTAEQIATIKDALVKFFPNAMVPGQIIVKLEALK